jgi:hypothetical protein
LIEYRDRKTKTPFYGTSKENNLGLDLEEVQTVCYIFTHSGKQAANEVGVALAYFYSPNLRPKSPKTKTSMLERSTTS